MPVVEGRVRLNSGEFPAAGAQVMLFDLTDLRRWVSTTTDYAGYFTLSLGELAPASVRPEQSALGQNYPNPSNPSTPSLPAGIGAPVGLTPAGKGRRVVGAETLFD